MSANVRTSRAASGYSVVFFFLSLQGSLNAEHPHLTVERIGSLPYLSGTAPSNPAWSPDSTRLAFLWNDQAMPFRDVWVVSADGTNPQRVTNMSSDLAELYGSDSESMALAERVTARQHRGVAEAIWTPNGDALIFAIQTRGMDVPRNRSGAPMPEGGDDLFQVNPDGTDLKRLTRSPGDKYLLSFSPDGKFLSYLQKGDLLSLP